MSEYYSFNDFMDKVINTADKQAVAFNSAGLEGLFNVSTMTKEATRSLMLQGFKYFSVIVDEFLKEHFFISAVIWGILSIPILKDVIVLAFSYIVAEYGGRIYDVLLTMYTERSLPAPMKYVAEKYKSSWERADGNFQAVDSLVNEASSCLCNEAFNMFKHLG